MKVGLLGNGIGRSRAKHLHELIGEQLGHPLTYVPMDLESRGRVSLADELTRCENAGFAGVNVTNPYKSEAFLAVHRTVSMPDGLTSVNTVLFREDGWTGTNTDCSGFVRAFRSGFGADAQPGRVLIAGAGAGGVGKAIAFALQELGAVELAIHDTAPMAARALASELDTCGQRARVTTDLAAEMRSADGLVNATPVGMFQYPGCVFPSSGLEDQRWAFDAVYTTEHTDFLLACAGRGIAVLSGFKLFLYQGLDAWQHFTGVAADAGSIERAFLRRYGSAG
ncbi:MAG: hypothetical protein R3E82_20300 [Pseudomonadales bacterium]